jgi:glyoxylate/hydroxypyruvate reductase
MNDPIQSPAPAAAPAASPPSTAAPALRHSGNDRPPSPIALIGSFASGEQRLWLEALHRAMPQERILPDEEIGAPDDVEVAIVANPDPAQVRRFENLGWVQSLWAGVEKLVAEPAFASIPVVRMVDPELGRTMAEAVLAWTLYLHRDMPAYLAQQRASQWRQLPYLRPADRRVGLLGLGTLGTAAARVLRTAGFAVKGWSRTPKRSEDLDGIETRNGSGGLHEVVSSSDILVCLLPLTQQTRHLVDATLLKLLPARASLINFGRGALVRTPDLIAALDEERLAHAVLDVFDEEPLPPASPLWLHPRVTVLPHISADTDPRTASQIVANNIGLWRQTGRIPLPVDRSRGY